MVLVVHEIFGVNEWVQDVCRRFAKLGYMAIAPALYARQGEIKDLKDPREILRTVYSKIPDTQSMSDLDSCAEWGAKKQRRREKSLDHGFLLGRPHRLALRRSQSKGESRSGMVRTHWLMHLMHRSIRCSQPRRSIMLMS